MVFVAAPRQLGKTTLALGLPGARAGIEDAGIWPTCPVWGTRLRDSRGHQ